MRCKEYSVTNFVHNSPRLKNPFSENFGKKILFLLKDYHKVIKKYIFNKYNNTIEKIIEKIEQKI